MRAILAGSEAGIEQDLAAKAVELGEILGADDADAGYDQLLLREIRDALLGRLRNPLPV